MSTSPLSRPVTVARLLDEPGLDLVLRAGRSHADNVVRWVHVSELADPGPYLAGAELVCLTGLGLDLSPPAVHAYVRRLEAAGVAGLGFGVSPVHDAVPDVLVRACEEVGLPLVEVPRGVPFIALSERVAALLTSAVVEASARAAEVQRALTLAASGARPVQGVVRRLASAVEGWAVLLDGSGAAVERAGGYPGTGAVPADLVRRVLDPTGPASAASDAGEGHAVLHHVRGEPRAFCLAVGRATPFAGADLGLIGVAASLLSVLTSATLPGTARRVGTALARTALGDPASEVGAGLLAAWGGAAPRTWRVVCCRPGPGGDPDLPAALQARPLRAPAEGRDQRVVLPDGPLLAATLDGLRAAGWLYGVSAPCAWPDVAAAGMQARRALGQAVRTGAGVDASDAAAQGLASLVPAEDACAFAVRVLAPLDAYDPGTRDVLLDTLHAWLGAHGRWEPTAEALDVHRNTVRHRIGSIREALGRDLDDARTRAELLLALEWRDAPATL